MPGMPRFRFASSVLCLGLCLALSACVPARQYEQLAVSQLDTGQSLSLTIHSQGAWRDTGVQVRAGEVYRVYTQGTWSAGPFCGPTGAEGLAVEHLMCMKAIFALNFPVPEGRIGALVGRIGENGKAFVVGGTQGFIAEADGTLFLRMNDPDDFIWDNVGEIEVAVQRFQEGLAPPGFGQTTATAVSGRSAPRPRVKGSGYFAAESDITFNVLERVEFDPATGELLLSGRFDPDLAGPRIPYLQHLAEFLDSPGPQASLDWTPEFERRVDDFFRRMDDPNAMGDLVGSGQLVDDNFNVTRKGRLYLPIFGVKPFDHGNAPGLLGASVSFVDIGVLQVDSVTPGGAADRAGIEVGDRIHMVTIDDVFSQPYIPATLTRAVRFAGAGKSVKLQVEDATGFHDVHVTLDAYPGDHWEHVTKYDILERIFRAADKPRAANLMRGVGGLLRNQDNQAGQASFTNLLWATDALELFYDNQQRYNRGEITQQQAFHEVARQVVRGMESAMELPYDSIVPIYDREYSRTGDPFGPIDVAILELNRRTAPFMKEALRTALYKNDQITMPVAVLDESQNFQPRVEPRYIGVPATSELARLFIEADYLGKALIHRPELSERIPAYRTEYAFTGSNPGRVEETTNRLWITPDRVEVRRSASRNTLDFGRVDMAINIGRAFGGGPEYRDDAYGRFLSGLYPDFAREFPALHELREAAKLAVVAKWLQVRQPGFRLPQEGRAHLSPPDALEGFVTLIWSPHSIKVTLIAPGGIDFNVPPIGPSGPVFPDGRTVNVPVDAAVVDLRDLGVEDTPDIDPQVFAPQSGSSIRPYYRRPLTEPPVPASVRLVARATKGERTLERIDGIKLQTGGGVNACDAEQARALNEKLAEAASIARQLAGAEKALNVITAQAAERQRTFTELEQTFRQERQRLRETMVDLATGGLMDAYDELKGTVDVRSIQDLETLIATMRSAKDKLGYYSEQLANLDLALSSAMASSLAERERATQDLLGFLKDTLGEGAKLKGNDPATRALRTAGKTLGVAGKVLTAADTAASLYTLNAAVERLQGAGELTERELQGLRDSLLPLQRTLSDRLDDVMSDPLVRDYEQGGKAFDCRG